MSGKIAQKSGRKGQRWLLSGLTECCAPTPKKQISNPDPKQESQEEDTDPLAMSGKIGYFGVGAQHSVTSI